MEFIETDELIETVKDRDLTGTMVNSGFGGVG